MEGAVLEILRGTQQQQQDKDPSSVVSNDPNGLENDDETTTATTTTIMPSSIIGFDVEYTRYYPALIQIATATTVYLFRIRRVPPQPQPTYPRKRKELLSQLPKHSLIHPLLPILEDATIIKAGASVWSDIARLQSMTQPFRPVGFANVVGNHPHWSLQTTYAELFHHRLPSSGLWLSSRRSSSAWETASPLSPERIRYAATDAWAARQIFLHMHRLPLYRNHNDDDDDDDDAQPKGDDNNNHHEKDELMHVSRYWLLRPQPSKVLCNAYEYDTDKFQLES
jgi:hypothetical protein